MAMQKVEAYKCSYCGKVMLRPDMHEFECRYNPKARTCVTCGFSYELKSSCDDDLKGVRYCLRKVPEVLSNLCFAVGESGGCGFCPYGKTNPDGACDVETLRKAIEGVIKNG